MEFGRTLQLPQDSSGVILNYEVRKGNPSDRSELLPVLRNAKTTLGIKPKELAADRGYYTAENVLKLRKAGIEKVGIPKVGRLSQTAINEPHGSANCNGFAVESRRRSACSNASLVWVECWQEGR